jgi:hypothetical protein
MDVRITSVKISLCPAKTGSTEAANHTLEMEATQNAEVSGHWRLIYPCSNPPSGKRSQREQRPATPDILSLEPNQYFS